MVQHLTLSLFLVRFLKDQYWVQCYSYYSLALAARRAAKRSPKIIPYIVKKRKPMS